jgi:hypothetical protein
MAMETEGTSLNLVKDGGRVQDFSHPLQISPGCIPHIMQI